MTPQVVGAGVGRTGTLSLKLALERLLGGTCHHMVEVFDRPEQVAGFTAAIDGETVDWPALLQDFSAIVDFPGSLFWAELAAAFPDAKVLLSTRDAEGWYRSASHTIFVADESPSPWMQAMERGFSDFFGADPGDQAAMIAAFERHNAAVRAAVPPDRLIDWTPGDGWGPICEGLGLPVPDEPFPRTNTTAEFRTMKGLDPTPPS